MPQVASLVWSLRFSPAKTNWLTLLTAMVAAIVMIIRPPPVRAELPGSQPPASRSPAPHAMLSRRSAYEPLPAPVKPFRAPISAAQDSARLRSKDSRNHAGSKKGGPRCSVEWVEQRPLPPAHLAVAPLIGDLMALR